VGGSASREEAMGKEPSKCAMVSDAMR
jgi:hypothetical protein